MDVRSFLLDITSDRKYRDQVVHVQTIQPREAQYAQPALPIPEPLQHLLRRQNIHRLYTHQASALDAIAAGKDIVIVTGTASGKTLCYNLPVVGSLLQDPTTRAMYMFPTKALTQDQHGTLQRWAAEPELGEALFPAIYDGDTPSHNRTKIRAKANVILTNPDMLHVGILPYHAKWHAFLHQLRFIVIDELHTYRGIFGSHVAMVLRRLMRMCEHYGCRPQIITCSATIANPVELAQKLTGRAMTLIDNDGSPRGKKHFVLWNPPLMEPRVTQGAGQPDESAVAAPAANRPRPPAAAPQRDSTTRGMLRRSANIEAVELLVELVRRRAQTIVFGKARIVVELIYKYAVEALAGRRDGQEDLSKKIRPYRGGYLPLERRQIEEELFSGKLLAVTSTNALELGIDVGALDAAILVGFPGTICSTWQQAGRAGRSNQDSLVIMLAYDDPIDQYLMRHVEYFFGAAHEHGVIDPFNPHILHNQLCCAAFEKPLSAADERFFGPLGAKVVEILAEEGDVKGIDGRYYWSNSAVPATQTNLRTISDDTYAIADAGDASKVLGNVDSISAPELVYPGAIYLHEGESYLVKTLDLEGKIALVEREQVDYYTQPVLSHNCKLGEALDKKDFLDGRLFFGPADVTWQTTAFKKIKYYTMEMIGQSKLDLPSQTLATTGCWWLVSEAMRGSVAAGGYNPIEALIGVRNLMLASLPAIAMCDRRDISGMVDSSNLGEPTIFVYDRYPGGVGFAQRGFELIDQWLTMCRQIVAECPCEDGCPGCVGLANLRPPLHQDPDLGGGYPVPDKKATILLLDLISETE